MAHEPANYVIRRKVLKLLGAGFDILDGSGNPVGYCKQKAFRLRESLTVFTDRSKSQALFDINTRSVIDFSATYEITLPSGELIGSMRRKGIKSWFRDHWIVFDADGNEVAHLLEDGQWMATIRRLNDLTAALLPQRLHLRPSGVDRKDPSQDIATCRTHFNPFVYKLSVTIHREDSSLDDLMILAMACVFAAIDARQDG